MRYVVVGGGVAGVSCVASLLRSIKPDDTVRLISSSSHVKTISNWRKIGQFTETFEVSEDSMFIEDSRFKFIVAFVKKWKYPSKELELSNGEVISYDKLCIATGASPKSPPISDSRIITLRDTHSARQLENILIQCKHVAIVGNGGIATELVYELKNVSISWIIHSDFISSTFFLPQVSLFLEKRMSEGRSGGSKTDGVLKRRRFIALNEKVEGASGCALGPDWSTVVDLSGAREERGIKLYRGSNVERISKDKDELKISLSAGEDVNCDAIIWATGVSPNISIWKSSCSQMNISSEQAISVDENMATNIPDVYACGDVCTMTWAQNNPLWKQMRLWTQARQMGNICGKSMISSSAAQDSNFCFELFAHVTTFYGFKVVFLGNFLAKNLQEWYVRQRETEETFVCCVMVDHRVVGATLIGETNLEETMENLILNATDLLNLEDHFLDPGIDIEDYFD